MKIKIWFKKHATKLVAVACGVFLACCSIVAFSPNSVPVETKAEGRVDSSEPFDNTAFNPWGGLRIYHAVGLGNVGTNTIPSMVGLSNVLEFERETYQNGAWRFKDNISYNSTTYSGVYTSMSNRFSSGAYSLNGDNGYNKFIIALRADNLLMPKWALNNLRYQFDVRIDNNEAYTPALFSVVEGYSALNSEFESVGDTNYITGDRVNSFNNAFSSVESGVSLLDNVPTTVVIDGQEYVYLLHYECTIRLAAGAVGKFSTIQSFCVIECGFSYGSESVNSYSAHIQRLNNFWREYGYYRKENINADRVGTVFRGVIENFFNIEIFPNFKLSYLLMLAIGVVLFGFALKFFLGG